MRPVLSIVAFGVLLAISAAVRAADAPELGTWKLNTAKSTGNVPKSETRTYAAAPDGGVALSWTRVTAAGKEISVKSTFKYDGKDYPVTGSPDFDTLSVRHADAYTTNGTQKRMGKVVGTSKRTVSKDGKTLTLAGKLTNAKGEETATTLVYDRQ